ncbi:hypothetical protein ABFV62_31835, partial [Pseudomonas syringae]|uniref:hypothetical protein n=1 Tax=Pseudomonas syringae TaxID=317 RepID=UPI0034D3E0C8
TGAVKAKNLILTKVQHNIEEGLAVQLLWEATPDQIIVDLNGQNDPCYEDFGGIPNRAAGRSGKVRLSTQGWAAAAVKS